MDRNTVLEILIRVSNKRAEAKTSSINNPDEKEYWDGVLDNLFDLKQELTALIEE